MSGRINYSNLSDSLKEQLNGLGLTEEQVNELIENALDDKVGELNGLMTEEKGDLVGAINELFQSANNGKELIANAIGEPVSADDTFSAMSDDINSLLSTFKTNMMNNGVMVESGDKFKSLIEKIKGLVEGGGNKGIQFISGTLGSSNYVSRNMTQTSGNVVNSVGCFKIPMPNFEPVLIYAEGRITSQACDSPTIYLNLGRSGGYSFSYRKASNVYYTTCYFYKMDRDSEFLYLQTEGISSSDTFDYYIIGVGEEDTTLLDSLKSILAEEGVTTTEEDDMASLITKVDEEFNDKNNEMSSLNTNITLLTNQVNNLTSELAGKVTPAGNAVAANVLSGKTFINSTGQVVTGSMANMSTHTQVADYVAWNTQSIYLGIPAGAYINASSTGYPEVYIEKTRLDSNLVPENIVSGKSICGVAGTAGGYNMIPGTKYVMSQGYVDGRSNPTLDMCTVYIKRDGRLTVNITFHGENRNEYIHAYTKDANGNVINTQSYDAGFGASDTYWNGVQVYANTYLNIVIQTNNGWYGKSYHWWYAILFDLE